MDPIVAPDAAVQAAAFFQLESLLSYQNVLLILAAWNLIEVAKKLWPSFWRGKVGSKLLVLMPMLVCQALVWATARWQPESTWGEKLVLGLVLAFMTAHAHDVLKRFGLHEYIPFLGVKLKPKALGLEHSEPDESAEAKGG